MNRSKVRDYLLAKPEAVEEYPFGPDVMVFKVQGKMFALLSGADGKSTGKRTQMNLKCDPLEAIQLRDVFDDVVVGYHMNKKHWNTLYLPDQNHVGDLPQGEIERQIDNSIWPSVKKYDQGSKTFP
ncbi:MAG: putative DNA-binding protein (MmcQ/YjbR family) [Oleispira sp.]